MTTLRIATRQSQLALWQAEYVARELRRAHPELEVSLVPMTTQGDRVLDRALAEVGGKALFVKELETALIENRADIAVHSLKDVPSELPPGMALAAMLPRADPRDAFLSVRYPSLEQLPQAAKVGTSSPRRHSQLAALRPDLTLTTLRGNVETRLRKLESGEYDAIVLASAGLHRLGLQAHITALLAPESSLPAVGQGIVAIECRSEDAQSIALCRALDDETTASCGAAERAFALELGGDCYSPLAAYAQEHAGTLRLRGLVGARDGHLILRDELRGTSATAVEMGRELARRLLAAGADKLLHG
jgi:hydroxymethylbilane synthase